MKKKVAFIVSSLNMGGAQRAVSSIVSNLPEDWDIRLVLNSDKNISYPYKGEIVSLGIDGGGSRTGLLYQTRVFIKRYFYIKKMKKDERFDAVISFLDSANILNILTGKSGKNIISVRNCISKNKSWKYKWIVGPLVRRLYDHADMVVALSDGVKKDLIDNYKIDSDKVITIYNCYNVNDINLASKNNLSLKMDLGSFNVMTAGRLCHQKGQWHLIRAFSEVVKAYPKACLHIFGDGDYKEYLDKLIEDLNLKNNIKIYGYTKDLYSIMGKMELFIFPSLYEGLGNVLIEALCCGLPCISTDYCYGAREVLQLHAKEKYDCVDVEYVDYGVLVPVMSGTQYSSDDELDEKELKLAKAIISMIKDEKLRLLYKEKAVERAYDFSAKTIIPSWIELIENS